MNLRQISLAFLPAAFGAGFIGLVWLDQMLFGTGAISARGAIGLELLYLLVFCGVLLWALGRFVLGIRDRHVGWSVLILAGLGLGVFLFTIGIGNGAAILYAT